MCSPRVPIQRQVDFKTYTPNTKKPKPLNLNTLTNPRTKPQGWSEEVRQSAFEWAAATGS